MSIPLLLLAVTILGLLGNSLQNVIIVLALTSWHYYARTVRGEVISLRENDFIQAAVAIGCSYWRIVLRHFVPNLLAVTVVLSTLQFARVVLVESALSFLGLGIDPAIVSWGAMVADGRDYLTTAWWLALWPGIAIMLTVLSSNFVGDWLRDLSDPKFTKRK